MSARRTATSDGSGADAGRTSRLRWLLPAALLLAWFVVAGIGGPFAGRLSEVQTNDNASFLPSSAESTRVVELQQAFTDSDVLPAIVVYELDRAVTPQGLAELAEVREQIGALAGVIDEVSPPIPAQDGLAVQLVVPIDGGDGILVSTTVEEVREIVAGTGPPGAHVYVTGPGGFLADFTEAFGEIDGLLLLVALVVVLVILLVVYRSPILPVVVLFSALLALSAASATIYALADAGTITLNGQSQGILFILVVGAATDYALLLVARFREELRDHASAFDAMRTALRGALEPIVASGGTVILGVLCLLFSDLNSNQGLGPVAAIGIAFSVLAALTFLPAALALLGRTAFWPVKPVYGSEHTESQGIWGRVAGLVGDRPRAVWLTTSLVLLGLAAFLPRFEADGVPQADVFLTPTGSVAGQEALARHFPAGSGSPAAIVGPAEDLDAIVDVAEVDEGVASVAPLSAQVVPAEGPPADGAEPLVADGRVLVEATLTDPSDSAAAQATVQRLRVALDEVGSDVLVGGQAAITLDILDSARSDLVTIIPLVLAVIFVVLALLLRALVAPLVLLVANILSFAATIGVSAIAFTWVFDFPGGDPAVPLFGFVFLVALGIDYSIFLVTRVREESLRSGTRPGILKGLTVTGGVITSAGIVLAATFAALAVLPVLFLAQIAFIVAFGVLLDTLVVRSLLVPAVAYHLGPRFWWPGKLARVHQPPPAHSAGGGRAQVCEHGLGSVASGDHRALDGARRPVVTREEDAIDRER